MQKTTDCIFIFSPAPDSESRFDHHLGSSYIISYLRTKGFEAQQYIRRDPVKLRTCIGEILACNPKVVGFSVYNTNFSVSALIAEEIRKLSPQTVIVFGGPCPSVHSDFIISTFPFVDACFINESEETFLKFITRLSEASYNLEKADLSGIEGITCRQSQLITRNSQNHTLLDHSKSCNYLDNYPSPYLSGIIPASEAHSTGLITARGCNQNCVYCTCAVLSNRRFSTHSVERVVSELDYISPHLLRNQILTFQDDTFTLIPNRARDICKAIMEHRIKVRLACITRCDCIDETLLDQMKDAGFVSLTFSLESADPKTLRRIGKVHAAEDIPSDNLEKERRFIESFDKMSAYAKKIGFQNIVTSIMVGLPVETIDEANHTIDYVDRNKNIDQYSHNFLKIFRGTPLYGYYEKYGYKLRCINGNPIFVKMIYPVDVTRKVFISPKSHLHSLRKENDKNTLSILSLTSAKGNETTGFNNIILQSDHISEKLIKWLKDVLSINGTIIQIYSGEKEMTGLSDRNYEKLVKYLSPSLNVRNYFLREIKKASLLLSSDSVLLKSYDESENIRLCDFGYFKSNLDETGKSFIKALCREEDYNDSVSAYTFLCEISRVNDPFSFLTRKKVLPYFANLCKWTRGNANCVSRSTLIISEGNEVRFCWYGKAAGFVGQSYDKIIRNLESEILEAKSRRQCDQCKEEGRCIKCPFPFPLPENEYCKAIKTSDVSQTAELIYGLDHIKQIIY